jgi:hypothetical protein
MTRGSQRAWTIAVAVAGALATAWVYSPALSSYFVLDDFGLLAYSRMLGNPLPGFVHDHFPGSLFFRPLTMAFWWLAVRIFGTAPAPHYVCNLVLHLAVAAALARLAFEWTRDRLAAALAGLLVALHPIGIGTALWLSDRFDLLAALFSLLALTMATRFREQRRASQAWATGLLALAAFLSKETGLVVVAPIVLLWSWPLADRRRWLTGPRIALAGLLGLAVAWLAWRHWLMQGPGGTLLLQDGSLVGIIWQGFLRWAEGYLRLFWFWPRLGTTARVCATAGALAWLALLALACRASWRSRGDGRSLLLPLAALALLLAPGVVQAPVTRVSGISLGAPDSAWPAAFAARFYYLSLCGLGVFAASLLARLRASTAAWRPRVTWVALVAGAAFLVPMSRVSSRLAGQFSDGSQPARVIAEAAVKAIDRLPLPARGCQVYLLDVDPALDWFFVPFADAMVKATTPDLAHLRDCLIQAEGTPWFQLVGRDALTPADVAPMLPLYDHGKRVPWMEIGNLEAVYLNLFPGADAAEDPGAVFLAWQGGGFVDVGAAVRAGTRHIAFRCLRPGEQCQCPGQACPAAPPLRGAAPADPRPA